MSDSLPLVHSLAADRTSAVTPQSLIAEILPFIRKRGFETGDRLPSERDLAQRFAVSRGTMREALAALEAVRMIERRPQSGIYLRSLSRDAGLDALVLESDLGIPMSSADVAELYEFRSIMEMQAVILACDRYQPDDLARIDAILQASAEDIAAGLPVADRDAEFHLAIFAAVRNQFLLRAANSFYLASRRRRDQYFATAGNGRRSLAQHRQLRNAIADRDRVRAIELLSRHLGAVERYWLSTLKEATKGSTAGRRRSGPPTTGAAPRANRQSNQ